MPIVVANTFLEELAALEASAMHHIALGARYVESDTWVILGAKVKLCVRVRPAGRSGRDAPHRQWHFEGRRKGWNALVKSMERLQQGQAS